MITGEGRIDHQTLAGKLPAIVAKRSTPTPTLAVVGRNDLRVPTTPFDGVYAVADIADSDTATDPVGTAIHLRQIGIAI